MLASLLVAAPASAGHVSRGFFGLSGFGGPENQSEWNQLGAAGVGIWRANLEWNKVEPNAPVAGVHDFKWSQFDTTVMRAANVGVRVLPRIVNAPGWANPGCNASNPVVCPPLADWEGNAKQLWLDFAAAAVTRYGPCDADPPKGAPAPDGDCPAESFWGEHDAGSAQPVDYRPLTWFQVWEEPNFHFRWCRTDAVMDQMPSGKGPQSACKPSTRQYGNFVKDTHVAMTGANPEVRVALAGLPELCTVTCGGVPTTNVGQIAYVEGIYRQATNGNVPQLKRHFQAVALHPYARGKEGIRGAVLRSKDVMKRYGGWNRNGVKVPIWITEFGWSTNGPMDDSCPGDPVGPAHDPYPPQCRSVQRHQRGFNTDWEGQKRKLKNTFRMLINHRTDYHLGRAIWFSFQDDYSNADLPGSRNWPHYTGLFFRDQYSNPPWPKPAWCGLIGTLNRYLHRSAAKPATPEGPKCAPPGA